MEPTTFREAYGVLQGHAETLREQTEPNIDELLSIVKESVAAYKVCKERIDAVEKALQEALTGVADEAPHASSSTRETSAEESAMHAHRAAPRPAPHFDEGLEDDIPF